MIKRQCQYIIGFQKRPKTFWKPLMGLETKCREYALNILRKEWMIWKAPTMGSE